MILGIITVTIILIGFFGLKIYHMYLELNPSARTVRPGRPQPKWTQIICKEIE